MLNGIVGKGTLAINQYLSLPLTGADPGYPVQVSITLINTASTIATINLGFTESQTQNPSNQDIIYQQFQLQAYQTYEFGVFTLSYNEFISLLSSADNVNYYITAIQSPD